MTTAPSPADPYPLDWTHAATAIPERGLSGSRTATAEERARLAATLDILSVERLSVAYSVRPLREGRFRLAGSLSGDVTQACVVSLEPVPGHIEEEFDIEFTPAAPPEESGEEEREISSLSDEEPLENGMIPLGRVVYELVATGLEPYPRKEGAALDWREDAHGDGQGGAFAELARLKDKGGS